MTCHPTCVKTPELAVHLKVDKKNLNSNSTYYKSVQSDVIFAIHNYSQLKIFSQLQSYRKEVRNPSGAIQIPDCLRDGQDRLVFGNIETIYEWHRE
jgi:hypothetical protein